MTTTLILEGALVADVTPDSPQSRPELLRYLPWVDVLRFVACFLVIALHAVRGMPAAVGHSGVALFFSISGFLIGRVLMENDGLPRFYSRRFMRIYPAYLATLAIFSVLLLLHFGNQAGVDKLFFSNLPYYLTFTFQLSPDSAALPLMIVWSLCVEELFYLLLPLVFLLKSRGKIALVMIAALALLSEPGIAHLPDGSGTWFLFPLNLFGGVLLALANPRSRKGFPWPAVVGILLLLVNARMEWFALFGPVSTAVCTGIVWSAATTSMRVPAFFEPVRWMGTLSYGMYLLHLICISIALRILSGLHVFTGGRGMLISICLILATVLTLMLSEAMRRAVEAPALRFRKVMARHPRWEAALMTVQVSLIPLGVGYALLRRSGL